MFRPTKRGFGLAGGAVLLFLIGTNIQSGWLFVLASLLLGAMIAGLVVPPLMIGKVSVERRAPENAHAGEDVRVDLVVTNPRGRTLLSLVLEDRFISRSRIFLGRLAGHESVVVTTLRRGARRGIYEGDPIRISSQAPFGVASSLRKLPGEGRVVVFPRVAAVGWIPDMASAAKPLQAAVVQARKGAGHDFIGIREYQQGDSLRHVHWPSTARHGSLMVREFEQELPRRMGIILDTSRDSGATQEGESVLDTCCSVAASFAAFALDQGHPLTMAAATGGAIDVVDGYDEVEALTWLAGVKVSEGLPFDSALEAAAAPLGRIDTLVMVFPTWKRIDARSILARTSAFEQIQPIAVLVNASGYPDTGGQVMSPGQIDDVASALSQAGVTVYRVERPQDLSAALEGPA